MNITLTRVDSVKHSTSTTLVESVADII